jgi:hypothetical protein
MGQRCRALLDHLLLDGSDVMVWLIRQGADIAGENLHTRARIGENIAEGTKALQATSGQLSG